VGIAVVVNGLAVLVVARAPSLEAADKPFEKQLHFTILPCDGMDVMPLIGPPAGT